LFIPFQGVSSGEGERSLLDLGDLLVLISLVDWGCLMMGSRSDSKLTRS
jgi:hypothetical protein